ncbi:MAG: PH domain-containing protein [Candidatus Paceibacterota bacterium]
MPDVFNAFSSSKNSTDREIPNARGLKKNHRRHVDEYSEIMRGEKSSKNQFKSFLPKPQKIAFDAQTGDERIILVLRQHPITLLKQAIAIILALFLPLFSKTSFLADFLPNSYILGLNLSWYMLIFSYTLATFLIWFFSVFIITDERIIDVDFVSLLFKDVSSAKIDAIQDISSKTSGFLASVINYGTVYIQTAGEQREIEFENIPQPAKVAALLNELILEEEQEKIEGRAQ